MIPAIPSTDDEIMRALLACLGDTKHDLYNNTLIHTKDAGWASLDSVVSTHIEDCDDM